MPNLEPILPHIAPFLMVLFRVGGLAVFAPVLSSAVIPGRVRLMVVLAFSLAMYPGVAGPTRAADAAALGDVWSLAAAVVAETLIGVTIGLLAALPMYAVQMGGQVVGQQVGMGLAGIYNPALDVETDVFGQLLMSIALAVFAGVGGLDLLFVSVAHSFHRVPAGGAVAELPPLELLTGVVASGFEVALRVSAPVLCILLIETIGTGFISKTLPQMNILSLGFAVKIVLAVLVTVWGLGAMGEVIGDDVRETLEVMIRWAAGGVRH